MDQSLSPPSVSDAAPFLPGGDARSLPKVDGSRRRVVLRRLVPALLLAAAAAWGAYWWSVARFVETTEDAYVHADVISVAPRIAGFVNRITFADNSMVKAGDVLIEIDPRAYRARLAEAEAGLAERLGDLESQDASRSARAAETARAAANRAAAEAELVRVAAQTLRVRALAEQGFVSHQRLEEAEADLGKARAMVAAATAAIKSGSSEVTGAEARIRQLQAAVARSRAEIDLARLDAEETLVRAPTDGIAANRTAQIGAYVRPGQQLLSLVRSESLWIEANFKEDQLKRMRVGQRARIVADIRPDIELTGRIESFSPATGSIFALLPAQNATGNFTKIAQRVPVRIRIDANARAREILRPGLSVVVSVDTRPDERES